MAKRTSRRAIRDKLDASAKSLDRAEQALASITAAYYDRGSELGALVEMMRACIQSQAQQVRDFRTLKS